MFAGGVVDVLRGVEAQAVEVKFLYPVAGDGEEEFADRPVNGAVEIARIATLGGIAIAEIVRRKLPEIIPVGADVVVLHIEFHAHTETMGAFHEAPIIVGCAVEPRGREEVYAVVSPAVATGEVRDRHDLQKRAAEVRELGQLAHRRSPSA